MSDKDLPDLPSDEDLGITEEDIRAWEAEQNGDAPAADEAPPAAPAGGKASGKARRGGTATEDAPPPRGPKDPPDAPPGTDEPEAPATPPPVGGFRGPLTLLVLFVVAVLSLGWLALPDPVPANAPADEFSSSRAMANLVEVARAPHPPGSEEHDRVREYLTRRLQSLGLEPTVQRTTSMARAGDWLRSATVRNVVARLPGTSSTGTILLTAHYDGRELSRAAGDDGIGVVTILETLRAVQAGEPLRNDLIVLFTDAEELGLLGARAFVVEHPLMADVTVALSVEMRGGGGPSLMFQTGQEGGWIIEEYGEAAPWPMANSLMQGVYERMPNDTDFTPFRDAGVQGLNFAGIGRANVYHQAYDTPENVSEATIQHHGDQLLAVVERLGRSELGVVDAPDRVYFTVPLFGLATYSSTWIIPLGILVLLLAAGTFVAVRRRRGRIQGMLVGLGLSIVASSLAFGAGLWLMGWLPRFHPEMGSLHGSAFHTEGWYVIALVGLVFALVTGLFGLVRRWYGAAELAFGAAVLPIAAALFLTFWLPSGAMNFQIPVLAGLVAVLAVSGAGPRRRVGWFGWILALLMALPALVLLAPLVEMVWLAMNLTMAAWLAVFLATGLFILLPVLDVMREPNGWWAPVLGLAATAAFVGVGVVAAGPSADQPTPSTLAYAVDRAVGEAFWTTQPVVGTDAEADPARAWAVDRAGAPFTDELDLGGFRRGGRTLPAAQAVLFDTPRPDVTVTAISTGALPPPRGGVTDPEPGAADSVTSLPETVTPEAPEPGGPLPSVRRTVRVGVRSNIGAEMVSIRLPQSSTPALVAINGQPVADAYSYDGGAPTSVPVEIEHWGRPDSMIYLDFEIPASVAGLEFTVVEELLRPEEIVPRGTFSRPPTLAPNIRALSDRAWIRTPVRLDVQAGATNTWTPPTVDPSPTPADTAAVATPGAVPADTTAAPAGPDTTAAPPAAVDTTVPPTPPDTSGAAIPPDTVGGAG